MIITTDQKVFLDVTQAIRQRVRDRMLTGRAVLARAEETEPDSPRTEYLRGYVDGQIHLWAVIQDVLGIKEV